MRKVRADSFGNETEILMDDLVEIGISPEGHSDEEGKTLEPIHLQKHRSRTGQQMLTLMVTGKPRLVTVELEDNLRPVAAGDMMSGSR